MHPTTPLLLVVVAALTSACSVDVATSVPNRSGPPFGQAFPDPSVLVTAEDTRAVRAVLDTVPLPETAEHHAVLKRVLAAAEVIDADHLVLLTEAVAIPPRLAGGSRRSALTTRLADGRVVAFSRGKGRFCGVIDDLLLAGAEKLSDPGARSFGRLVAWTQTPATIRGLADLLLEQCDDGSVASLKAMLGAIRWSGPRLELCIEVLLPRGRLQAERGDVAVESLSFDSERTRLITALYAGKKSLDAATLTRHAQQQSFDAGRAAVVELGVPIVERLNGAEALALVRIMSFDAGRQKVLAVIRHRLELRTFDEVLALVRRGSFDAGRRALLTTLMKGRFPAVRADDVIALAGVASFDTDRGAMLELVVPRFEGGFVEASARGLLKSFSFDDGRLRAVRLFREPLGELSHSECQRVLGAFSFSSGKESASALLAR